MQNLHFIKLRDEKNTALDSTNVYMKLLNNFRQYMIFMLTSVFTVEASETKKLKNDTKFTNLFELKVIVRV